MLADLIDWGLETKESRLYTLDWSKILTKAVRRHFQRKDRHTALPGTQETKRALPTTGIKKEDIDLRMSSAYREYEYKEALTRLGHIAKHLEHRYPAAAASLREGLDETLTVHRLGLPGLLRQSLSSTNAIESANSVCAGIIRRVTCFRTGEVALRQAAAGFIEAERGFIRIKGYREIPVLINALIKLTDIEDKDSVLTA